MHFLLAFLALIFAFWLSVTCPQDAVYAGHTTPAVRFQP